MAEARPLPPIPRPPAEIAWLVQAIGPTAALRLIEEFGGTEIYVPRRPPPTSPLVEAIGAAAAAALAEKHGTHEIKVPSAKRWRVGVYASRGISRKQIALRVGLNQRTVERYVAHGAASSAATAPAPASLQGSLDL